ncbi:MAG: hypothetical protein IMZ62_17255 [Chloroflexi bacterium]|nr:hypothetical protein [Chloroflexota bacterium]
MKAREIKDADSMKLLHRFAELQSYTGLASANKAEAREIRQLATEILWRMCMGHPTESELQAMVDPLIYGIA